MSNTLSIRERSFSAEVFALVNQIAVIRDWHDYCYLSF